MNRKLKWFFGCLLLGTYVIFNLHCTAKLNPFTLSTTSNKQASYSWWKHRSFELLIFSNNSKILTSDLLSQTCEIDSHFFHILSTNNILLHLLLNFSIGSEAYLKNLVTLNKHSYIINTANNPPSLLYLNLIHFTPQFLTNSLKPRNQLFTTLPTAHATLYLTLTVVWSCYKTIIIIKPMEQGFQID